MAGPNGAREGFNANDRARKRESVEIVLGEVTYKPARLPNSRLRQIRRLSREANARARDLAKETEEYKDEFKRALDDGLEEREAKRLAEEAGLTADIVDENTQESLCEQLPLLLVGPDGKPPTEEAIREHLEDDIDARDVGDLMNHLLGADPQPAAS